MTAGRLPDPPTDVGARRAVRLGGAFVRIAEMVPPASGAEVMGAGILSIGLLLDGQAVLSVIFLAIDAATWVVLLALFIARVARRDFVRIRSDAGTPAALTVVAGSAVLGTRLTLWGWVWAGYGLLVISVLAWAALLGPVVWRLASPTRGASLLLSVSSASLAILAFTLADARHLPWLAFFGIGALALGVGAYLAIIARFDLHQLLTGRGDQWIAGGALATCAVAIAKLTTVAHSLRMWHGVAAPLRTLAVCMWVAAMLWLAPLIISELVRPRLRFDVRRWSSVFPLGMYAAAGLLVGSAAHASLAGDYGRVWVWVALAGWTITALATARRVQALITARP